MGNPPALGVFGLGREGGEPGERGVERHRLHPLGDGERELHPERHLGDDAEGPERDARAGEARVALGEGHGVAAAVHEAQRDDARGELAVPERGAVHECVPPQAVKRIGIRLPGRAGATDARPGTAASAPAAARRRPGAQPGPRSATGELPRGCRARRNVPGAR